MLKSYIKLVDRFKLFMIIFETRPISEERLLYTSTCENLRDKESWWDYSLFNTVLQRIVVIRHSTG